MNDLKKMQILESERSKYKRYCKCGHSQVFPPTIKKNKLICTWCGSYIYKNDLEEFKGNLLKNVKATKTEAHHE